MNHRVNWGSIFGGTFIGAASMVFFSLFAMAVGIGGFNVIVPVSSTSNFGQSIYTIITSVISFWVAGYCTGRLGEQRLPSQAVLHALVSFSLAAALMPVLFTRAMFIGTPGIAVAPPTGIFISAGMAWALFLSFALSALAACAGGVASCYQGGRARIPYGEERIGRAA